MATATSEPSIGQIEQACISIQNGWTRDCREQRRREAHARLDWLAELLSKQISRKTGTKHRGVETTELRTVQTLEQ